MAAAIAVAGVAGDASADGSGKRIKAYGSDCVTLVMGSADSNGARADKSRVYITLNVPQEAYERLVHGGKEKQYPHTVSNEQMRKLGSAAQISGLVAQCKEMTYDNGNQCNADILGKHATMVLDGRVPPRKPWVVVQDAKPYQLQKYLDSDMRIGGVCLNPNYKPQKVQTGK